MRKQQRTSTLILFLLYIILQPRFLFLTLGTLPRNPDSFSDFLSITAKYGYQSEAHQVITQDGYILKLFRFYKHTDSKNQGKVVFMQHGIIDGADSFINNGPELGPAFILADQGYDVWLGNSRGTRHSRKHQTLDPDNDQEFWDFSFVEMGRFDIQASVDYVLKITQTDKIDYIGYSMGSTQMFLALSQNQDWWSQKIKSFTAIAPVVNFRAVQSKIIKTFAHFHIPQIARGIGIQQFAAFDQRVSQTLASICMAVPYICEWVVQFIGDSNITNFNRNRLDVYLANYPCGASSKSLEHFAQSIRSGRLAYFDYGETKNLEIYNQIRPPLINLQNIKKVPIGLIVGKRDQLATIEDAQSLKHTLEPTILNLYHETNHGHAGFLMGTEMSYMEEVITFMQSQE